MIKKTYLLSSNILLSKKYCNQNHNIGYIPCTITSLVNDLYNHPAFYLDNESNKLLNEYQLDVKMCEVLKGLDQDNYFFDALRIKGNRALVLSALQEIKMSFDGDRLDNLKLPDEKKTKGLAELYSKYKAEKIADYPETLNRLIIRLKEDKYKNILSNVEIKQIDILNLRGHENTLISLLKNTCTYEEIINTDTKFNHAVTKCSSALDPSSAINKALSWMDLESLNSQQVSFVALDYDRYASVLYLSKDKYPIYLEDGLRCLYFSFFNEFMTILAEQKKRFKDQDEFIKKIESSCRYRSEDKNKGRLEKLFYTKVLSAVAKIKDAGINYKGLSVAIDLYELVVSEAENLKFSASELELKNEGIRLSKLESSYALSNENVVILGLSHSNYPKKLKIDPVLKEFERESINNSLDAFMVIKPFIQEGMLEKLLSKLEGKAYLSYESHDLETGKLSVPSSFFNKILKAQKEEVKVENIYKLCEVRESYVSDIKDQSPFVDFSRGKSITSSIVEQNKKFFSDEIEDIDYSTNDKFKDHLSASSLETFYKCPHQFNLRHNLKIKGPDLEVGDYSQWLDAMTRGTFLHKAYEELLNSFDVKNGSYSDYLDSLNEESIMQAIDDTMNSKVNQNGELLFKDYNQEVSQYIRDLELEEIKGNLTVFIEKEISNCDVFYPVAHELKFEFEWELEGTNLHFKGFIDRVDADGKGSFRVIDYKTGRNYFKSNREYLFLVNDKKNTAYKVYLQHALYTKALLNSQFKDEIKIIDAGYYFTSDNGEWAKVLHLGDDSAEKLESILKTYIEEAKSKKYFKNGNQCKWCEYKPICKDLPKNRKEIEFPQLKNLLDTLRSEK